MRNFAASLGIAALLSFIFVVAAQAKDAQGVSYDAGYFNSRARAVPSTHRSRFAYASDLVASQWPAHDDMGEAGYFGGSSGGIPGTGVTNHRSAYENDEVGILPEDRPYPVWTQPGRLLR